MSKELTLLTALVIMLIVIAVKRDLRAMQASAVAFVVALVWALIAHEQYGYNSPTLTLASVNSYALLGWTLGLTTLFLIMRAIKRRLQIKNWWSQLILLNIIYIPLLIILESIAYHGFNVINLATANYAGLAICDCLHAPVWMQAVYLAMGSVYFTIISFVEARSKATAVLS